MRQTQFEKLSPFDLEPLDFAFQKRRALIRSQVGMLQVGFHEGE